MKYTITILCLILFSACTKAEDIEETQESYGIITGKVYGFDYNSGGVLIGEDYLGDQDVFISTKGTTNYFSKTKTAYDGAFTFENLDIGEYDIWVFGDCDYCVWDQRYFLVSVELASMDEVLIIDDIEITF